MSVYIPMQVFYWAGVGFWLYFAYAVLVMRSIDGRSMNERPITSIAIALAWPVTSAVSLIADLFRSPNR